MANVMTEEEVVREIRSSLKRSDAERWRIGDLLVEQFWINDETMTGIAEQVDVKPATLKMYRDVAREFPTDQWRTSGVTWGVLEKLRAVPAEKDRWALLGSRNDPSTWTATTMLNAVTTFMRKERTRIANEKREARGLPPLEEKVQAKFLAEKSGCAIYGHKVGVEYTKASREITIVVDVPLDDVQLVIRGGKTALVGVVPLDDEDLDD